MSYILTLDFLKSWCDWEENKDNPDAHEILRRVQEIEEIITRIGLTDEKIRQ